MCEGTSEKADCCLQHGINHIDIAADADLLLEVLDAAARYELGKRPLHGDMGELIVSREMERIFPIEREENGSALRERDRVAVPDQILYALDEPRDVNSVD